MSRVQVDSAKLASDYNEEKARLERHINELNETAKREAERAARAHQQQVQELERRVSEAAAASAAEKAKIERELDALKRRLDESDSDDDICVVQ